MVVSVGFRIAIVNVEVNSYVYKNQNHYFGCHCRNDHWTRPHLNEAPAHRSCSGVSGLGFL